MRAFAFSRSGTAPIEDPAVDRRRAVRFRCADFRIQIPPADARLRSLAGSVLQGLRHFLPQGIRLCAKQKIQRDLMCEFNF
jgi:hypothetical protein